MSILNDIRTFLASGFGKVLTASAVLAALIVLAICKLLVGVVGLPLGLAGLIVFGSFVAFLATAVCIGLKRFGVWSSGGTVGAVIFVIWLLAFLMWEGTRIYLYATDLYQWSFLAKWGWFTVSWVGVAAAAGIFVTLVYKGPKVVIWAFTILSVLVTGTAIIDASQFGPAYRSPFSGELMVKASVLPDGSTYPIPMGATFDRMHPEVTDFRELDLKNPEDKAILRDWYTYGVSQGVTDEDIEARKECAAAKAAAKAAGAPIPNCSTTGMPAMQSVTSGMQMPNALAEMLGESSEFPVRVDLSNGEELTFHADLLKEAQMGSALNLLVCEAQEGNKLLVRNGGVSAWMEQSNARAGVPTSLVFDHSVPSGVRTVEVRYAGRGHIMAVIGRVGTLGLSCDPGTTGYLVGKAHEMKEQAAAAKAGAAAPE